MKLYEIPKGSKLKYGEYMLTLENINKMYSRFTTEDGQVAYLAVWTPVQDRGDYYEVGSDEAE